MEFKLSNKDKKIGLGKFLRITKQFRQSWQNKVGLDQPIDCLMIVNPDVGNSPHYFFDNTSMQENGCYACHPPWDMTGWELSNGHHIQMALKEKGKASENDTTNVVTFWKHENEITFSVTDMSDLKAAEIKADMARKNKNMLLDGGRNPYKNSLTLRCLMGLEKVFGC